MILPEHNNYIMNPMFLYNCNNNMNSINNQYYVHNNVINDGFDYNINKNNNINENNY